MQAWENFLIIQDIELGNETVNKWLRSLKVLRFDACNLYLQARDTFQILWFEEHVRAKAQKNLRNNNNKPIKVHLTVDDKDSPSPKAISKPGKTSTKTTTRKPSETKSAPILPKFTVTFDGLDPHCTFAHFVESQINPVPHRLIFQILGYQEDTKTLTPSKKDLAVFNPIYLCGPEGTGKTHLLMAIAHAMRSQGLSVIYVRAETFAEHVISAIRAGEMSHFRDSYRNVDVLLIDDAHLLSKKWATQEEFFHTFNALHLVGRQVILSANCLPNELQFIEPRLISRFEWGIVIPIEPPQKDEIKKIFSTKAAALNFPIPSKVIDWLVDTFPSGTKAIARALEALILRTHLSQGTPTAPHQLTVPVVQQHLSDLIHQEKQVALNPEKIINVIAEFFCIESDDVTGKAQSRDCALPRQIAMHFCRAQLKLPFTKIGDIFGRDHSTVMSSVKLIQKGIDNNIPEIITSWNAIFKKIKLRE